VASQAERHAERGLESGVARYHHGAESERPISRGIPPRVHQAGLDDDVLAGRNPTRDTAHRHLDLAFDHLDSLFVNPVSMREHATAGGDLRLEDGARAGALARGLDEGGPLAGDRIVDRSIAHGGTPD